MKRKITIVMLLTAALLVSNGAKAQNTSPFWSLAGNSNATAASKMGTTNDIPLRLLTVNAERMRINGNVAGKVGFVGIGTTVPNTRLHVNGVVTATGGTSTIWNFASRVAGAYTTGRVPRWSGSAFVNGSIYDNGANVGIGTATPATKVDISGGIMQVRPGGYIRVGALNQSTDNFAYFSAAGQLAGTGLKFETTSGSGSAVGATRMTILNNGNVGIGTNSPSDKLHVSTGGNYGVLVGGGTVTGGEVKFTHDGTQHFSIYNDGLSALAIARTSAFGGTNIAGAKLITIGHLGNTAIGTGSVQSTLNVGKISGAVATADFLGTTHTSHFNHSAAENTYIRGGINSSNVLIADVGSQRVNVGSGNPLSFKFEVNGSAGKPGGGSWGTTSDARLKQKVQPYNDGLAQIMQIKPVRYHYIEKSGFDTKPEYVGVLAQDLKEVAPYMVGTFTKDNTEYYNVDNSAMTYMLINAVKEQQKQLDAKTAENIALTTRLDKMEDALQNCCTSYSPAKGELNNNIPSDKASLYQNAPNPFSEATTIRYYVPSGSTAVLKVMSLEGQEILSESVNQAGYGEVIISGSTMAAGTYTYTLLVNGKAAESKIMVLTK